MGLDLTDPPELDWIAKGRAADGIESRFSERNDSKQSEDEKQRRLRDAVADELLDREPGRDQDTATEAATAILTKLDAETIQSEAENAWKRVGRRRQDGDEFMPQFFDKWASNLVETYAESNGNHSSSYRKH